MTKVNDILVNEVPQEPNDEVQRCVMVYDVPKSWIKEIKRNRMTMSSYAKQAIREKLQRDDMLPRR
ncbi:MAG: hypothetical protein ACK4M7_01150 [Burkholderiales bacterium]